MQPPSTGWTVGGAATSSTQPLTTLPSQASISSDLIPIYSASLAGLYATNVETLLGVSAQVMSISDPQTVSAKTFNNTNGYTALDGSFTLQHTGATTKQAQFSLAGITAGQTRIITFPDYNAAMASLAGTETLTNKTITAPTTTAITNTGGLSTDTLSTSGTATLAQVSITGNNGIVANNLATNAITLGYAQSIAGNFTTTSATAVQVTSLSATVTIPAGGRKIKITAFARDMYGSTSSVTPSITIWDGTVGSGTQLAQTLMNVGSGTSVTTPAICMAVVSPAAGSKTYNVGFQTNTGTATLENGSGYPMFILVEAI